MSEIQKPELVDRGHGEYYEHPAYGLLGFSRCQGGITNLVGSSVQHHNFIKMSVKRAYMSREYHENHFFSDDTIVECYMSYSQFAEVISSMNMGDGVPVTLTYTEKDGPLPRIDYQNKRTEIEREFEEHVNQTAKKAQSIRNEVAEIFESKKNLTKADKEQILRRLDKLTQDVGANASFTLTQFNRQMEKTVTEAKGEVEAFVQNKMFSLANAAMVEHPETLLESPISVNIDGIEEKPKGENE